MDAMVPITRKGLQSCRKVSSALRTVFLPDACNEESGTVLHRSTFVHLQVAKRRFLGRRGGQRALYTASGHAEPPFGAGNLRPETKTLQRCDGPQTLGQRVRTSTEYALHVPKYDPRWTTAHSTRQTSRLNFERLCKRKKTQLAHFQEAAAGFGARRVGFPGFFLDFSWLICRVEAFFTCTPDSALHRRERRSSAAQDFIAPSSRTERTMQQPPRCHGEITAGF